MTGRKLPIFLATLLAVSLLHTAALASPGPASPPAMHVVGAFAPSRTHLQWVVRSEQRSHWSTTALKSGIYVRDLEAGTLTKLDEKTGNTVWVFPVPEGPRRVYLATDEWVRSVLAPDPYLPSRIVVSNSDLFTGNESTEGARAIIRISYMIDDTTGLIVPGSNDIERMGGHYYRRPNCQNAYLGIVLSQSKPDTSCRTLVRLDDRSLEVKWTLDISTRSVRPLNEKQLLISDDRHLKIVDATNGKVLWSSPEKVTYDGRSFYLSDGFSSAFLRGDALVVPSDSRHSSPTLVALSTKTSQILWTHSLTPPADPNRGNPSGHYTSGNNAIIPLEAPEQLIFYDGLQLMAITESGKKLQELWPPPERRQSWQVLNYGVTDDGIVIAQVEEIETSAQWIVAIDHHGREVWRLGPSPHEEINLITVAKKMAVITFKDLAESGEPELVLTEGVRGLLGSNGSKVWQLDDATAEMGRVDGLGHRQGSGYGLTKNQISVRPALATDGGRVIELDKPEGEPNRRLTEYPTPTVSAKTTFGVLKLGKHKTYWEIPFQPVWDRYDFGRNFRNRSNRIFFGEIPIPDATALSRESEVNHALPILKTALSSPTTGTPIGEIINDAAALGERADELLPAVKKEILAGNCMYHDCLRSLVTWNSPAAWSLLLELAHISSDRLRQPLYAAVISSENMWWGDTRYRTIGADPDPVPLRRRSKQEQREFASLAASTLATDPHPISAANLLMTLDLPETAAELATYRRKIRSQLSEGSEEVRRDAVNALSSLGTCGTFAVPQLLNSLERVIQRGYQDNYDRSLAAHLLALSQLNDIRPIRLSRKWSVLLRRAVARQRTLSASPPNFRYHPYELLGGLAALTHSPIPAEVARWITGKEAGSQHIAIELLINRRAGGLKPYIRPLLTAYKMQHALSLDQLVAIAHRWADESYPFAPALIDELDKTSQFAKRREITEALNRMGPRVTAEILRGFDSRSPVVQVNLVEATRHWPIKPELRRMLERAATSDSPAVARAARLRLAEPNRTGWQSNRHERFGHGAVNRHTPSICSGEWKL